MPASSSIKKVRIALVGGNGKMGRMISSLAKADAEMEICEDCDVVIDFSSPEGTKKAIAMGKPLVCGTTGLSQEIFHELEELATQVPVLYSPNFSLGIALFFQLLEDWKKKLGSLAKIEIEERHHLQKKDIPSGTALKMAEILGIDEVMAERVGDVVGMHQVKFSLAHEALWIRHEAHSREAFAQGALLAAKKIWNRPPKMYALLEIFD